MKIVSLLFTFVVLLNASYAGGLHGTVKSDDGTPLAYATIYIKQSGTGTTTNENGFYEIALPTGQYDVVFQFLGYETQTHTVSIADEFTTLDLVLKTQITVLQNIVVRAGKEDPAYTIMRKAIAKANYHTQQLDAYTARVYIKGTGQLKDYPWIFKKEMQKEGIDKDRVFVSESITDVEFRRPNTFKEKIIAVHSDGKDNNTSPNGYIFGSFYSPQIAQTISPLSPKAFSYYRFEYQGTFKDRDYEISRIKVTPRIKGDNVVEGMLYLVEDAWSIHSLDFITTKLGIRFQIKQVYAPVEDQTYTLSWQAWMPVSHRFQVYGKVFGFEFEYNYLATLSNYRIVLNKELYVETIEVIDEKIEKEKAKEITKNNEDGIRDLQKRLSEGKEITRKELRTIVKEYEKQELKKQKEPDIVSNYFIEKDSITFKKDTAYWNQVRPVPLTLPEIKGYQKTDSLAAIERKKEEGDTLKQGKHKGFQPWDLLTGDSYRLSKHSNLAIKTPMLNFNTVEGWNLIYRLSYGVVLQDSNKTRIRLTPTFRYAFAREKASGILSATVQNKNYFFELTGGRYVRQFNAEQPILPLGNTLSTLFFERNLMKIYERDYIETTLRKNITPKVSVSVGAEWSNRRELDNSSNYKWVDRKKIEGYTPNNPFSDEAGGFVNTPTHQALIFSGGLSLKPWLKYRMRNGRKIEIENSSPLFYTEYTKGLNIANSDVDYDHVEAGYRHTFSVGGRGKITANIVAGAFLNTQQMFFMDYKHFLGNRTPFATADPVKSFRLLDYYQHSTRDKYAVANVHYQFRRFLVTSLPFIRMMGIREDIFVNYLATPTSKNYTELGYSIDGILRFFRLEAAASFQNGKYIDYGFRIGVSTTITVQFSDN